MNLLRAAEFKVGLLVLAVAGLIAYMSLQVSENPSYFNRSNDSWFMLSNANGLVKNSAIRMAGIPMGVIKDIKLQDGMARVEITVRPDVKMKVSASVEIKSQGILGDKHVELSPGSPTDPPLPPNGQILNVKDKGSLDGVITQVSDIAADLKEVASVLRESISRDGNREHVLGRIVLNIEKLTQDLSEVTAANKGKLNEIVDQVNDITSTLDEALNDDSEEGFKTVWKKTLTRVDKTMKNIEEITGKVNRGEGTIGKLISDEDTADKVSVAVDGISNLVESANKISTSLDLSSSYMSTAAGQETKLNVIIKPGLDRYYLLGLVSNPFGNVVTTTTTDTGSINGTYTESRSYSNALMMNLEYAKIFYDFTIRGGLIQNYGGFGADYTFYHDKATVSVDFFNFNTLNIRPYARLQIWKGLYVTGGVYDALNQSKQQTPYLGAGLFLTNDDLKLLLTKSPL